jgi:hypothetical protein
LLRSRRPGRRRHIERSDHGRQPVAIDELPLIPKELPGKGGEQAEVLGPVEGHAQTEAFVPSLAAQLTNDCEGLAEALLDVFSDQSAEELSAQVLHVLWC